MKFSLWFHLSKLGWKGIICLSAFFLTLNVFANPTLNNISAGNVSVQQSPNSTVVNQSSQKAILNWHNFNINQQESVHFQQPAGGVALNRINPDQGASSIYGKLTATGQIILVNPAGIYFGPSAYVNVGGLIATTANISDRNFLNGNYIFTKAGPYSGSIVNEGTIVAANNGLVALVGSNVTNEGLVQANLGKVVLASGEAFTMSFAGNEMINFSIDAGTASRGVDRNGNPLSDGVRNTGSLIANGGSVIVTAKAARGVLDHVINMGGIVEAKSVSQRNGEIILSGDKESGVVRVAANLNASGKGVGQKGGKVEITGYNIVLDSPTSIDVSGHSGGGKVNIGGNYQGKGPLPNANAVVMLPNTKILADADSYGNGGDVILWSDNVTKAYGKISARGGSLGGDGGFVETSSHNYLDVRGMQIDLLATNGKTGNWLLDPADLTICTSCTTTATFSSNVYSPGATNSNLLVTDLTTSLGSANITVQTTSAGTGGNGDIIVNTSISWASAFNLILSAYRNISVALLSSITNTGGGSVVLRADNTGTGTGTVSFAPGSNVSLSGGSGTSKIYYNPTTFGTQNVIYSGGTTPTQYMLINSLGAATDSSGTTNTRSLATVSNSPSYWGQNFALAKDIDASATSGWNSGSGFVPIGTSATSYTGKFDGNYQTITGLTINRSSTDNVGFFGYGFGATIENTRLISPVITGRDGTGGFIGSAASNVFIDVITTLNNNSVENGTIVGRNTVGGFMGTTSGATTVNRSFSTGSVSGTSFVGGFMGVNQVDSVVNDSYSSANVSGTDTVGGFVGFNNFAATIARSYSTGYVNGSTNTFAFVGNDNAGTFTNDYVDTETSGRSDTHATTKTTTQMMQQATYSGWNFSTTWGIIESKSFPYLQWRYSSTPQAASGIAYSDQGITALAPNRTVNTLVAGSSVGLPTLTTANGFYYFLFNNGTIPTNSPGLIYLDNGATKGNVVLLANSNASATDVNIFGSTVRPLSTDTTALSNSLLNTAKGSSSDTDILYSVSSGNLTLTSGNNFNTSTATSYDVDGNISVTAANLTLNGSVTISATNPTLSTTTSGDITINGNVSNPNGLTIDTAGSSSSISSVISGAGALTKIGSGTLQLSGLNSYTGGTNIVVGTLRLGASDVLSDTGAVVLTSNDGFSKTFDLNNFSETIGSLAGGFTTGSDTASVTLGSATLTTGDATSTSFGGAISGTGGLTKRGSGTFTLFRTNTYTGATNINAGTLRLGDVDIIPDTSAVSLANVSGATLNLNNFSDTIGSLAGGGATGGNVSLGSGTLTAGGNNTSTTYTGVISGTGGLTKQGSGTFTLSGANSYSGATTVSAGTMQLGVDNAIPTGSATTVNATLNLNDHSQSLLSLAGASTGTVTNSSGTTRTLTLNNIATTTYNGTISGNLNLVKTNPGQATLNKANTYTGTTTVTNGTLSVTAANALPSTTALSVASTFVMSADQTVVSISGAGQINAPSNATLTVNNSSLNTFGGTLTGSLALTKTGAGTLALTNTGNSYINATTINNGTLQLGAAGVIDDRSAIVLANTAGAIFDLNNFDETVFSLAGGGTSGGNVTLGSGTLTTAQTSAGTATYSGVISGTGGFIKGGTSNSSVQILSGLNTYSGTTTISTGTLRLGASGVLSDTGAVVLTSNDGFSKAFDLNNFSETIGSLAGGFTTGSDTASVTLGSGTLTTGDATSTSFGGAISGTGGLTKQGSGTFTLFRTNTYTGATNINAGTLRLGDVDIIPDTSAVSLANVSGATLNLNNFSDTIGSLAGGGATGGNVSLGSGTLTTGSDNTSTTYTGVISGTGGITKIGGSTFTLAGNNTYSGTTTISLGIISVTNAAGLGSTAGATTITSPGTLNINGVSVGAEPINLNGNGNGGNGALTGTGTASLSGNIALGSDSRIGISNLADTLTLSGVISNGFGITKVGSGALVLSGANTYSGTTTVNAGTLRLGAANVIPGAVSLANTAGVIFDLNNFNETISSLAGGGTTGGNVTLGSGTLTTGASSSTYSGVISGTGGLTKEGTGTFTLSGLNTYTGATTINGSVLQLGAADVLSDSTAVSLANTVGATLDLNGNNESIASLAGGGSSGGNVSLGSGTLTVGSGGGGSTTYSGAISGTGGLTKIGGSTFTLAGNNTYSGTTTISLGIVSVTNASGLGSTAGATTITSPGTLNINGVSVGAEPINLNGNGDSGNGALTGTGTASLSGNIALGSNSRIGISNLADTLTLSGVISNGFGITKVGAGALVLSGGNSYSGATTVNAGTLRLGASNVIPNASAVSLANTAGVVFDLNNFNEIIDSLTGGGTTGGNVTLGSGTLTTGASSSTYSGVISGTGGLTKEGSGTFTIAGLNSYTGATTINGGVLQLGAADVLSDSTAVSLANTSGAILDLNGNNESIASLAGGGSSGGNVTLGSGTLTIGSSASTTYSGVVSGTGGITKIGAGTFTLGGSNTYSGTTTVNAGTLRLGAADAISDTSAVSLADTAGVIFDLNNFNETVASVSGGAASSIALGSGTLTAGDTTNTTYAGVISGTNGNIVKQGTGTLTVSGANTYSGTTSINAGILNLTNAAGLGSTAGGTTVASGAALNLAGITIGAEPLTLNGSGISGTGALTGSGTSILGGNIALGSNTTFGGTGTMTLSGVISGSSMDLTKTGTGILILSGANTYSGTTAINTGTLRLGAADVISDASAVNLANTSGANLDLNGFNETIASLSGGGTSGGNILLGSGILTTGDSSNTTYSGVISGSGGLSKAGSGTFTIANANTYTGATTINGGTLNITNDQGLGATSGGTSVNNGGTLYLDNVNIGNEAITLNNGILDSTGPSSLSGDITLASATNDLIETDNLLTLTGNINGSGNLTLEGNNIAIGGLIGNTSALASLTSDVGTLNLNGGAVTTQGNQTYNSAIDLGATTTFAVQGNSSSSTGIDFTNGVSGNQDLNLMGTGGFGNYSFNLSGPLALDDVSVTGTAGGASTFALNTGGAQNWTINGTDVASIGANGVSGTFATTNIQNLTGGTASDTFTINGGTIAGNISGGGGTNTLNADNINNTWNVSASNAGTVNGVGSFSNMQNLAGGTSNDEFYLTGGSVAGSVDGGAGSNLLAANDVANTWTVTGSDTGTVTSIGGGFANIQNLTGGSSNDSFTLNGGTVSGNVNGGAGTNAITANNMANVWNVLTNNGGSVTGISGSFSNIQNFTGGNSGNTFIFANNTQVDGTINGGSLSQTNTLNYANYTAPLTVVLSSTNDGVTQNGSNVITHFTNINNITNNAQSNMLILPNKSNSLVINGAKVGVLNDPINFNGFQIFTSQSGHDTVILHGPGIINAAQGTIIVNGVTMYFIGFNLNAFIGDTALPDVANIIQQPNSNASSSTLQNEASTWTIISAILNNNLIELTQQAAAAYDVDWNKIKINPYCYATQ